MATNTDNVMEQTREKFSAKLIKLPFEPFVILLANGQRLEIVRRLQAAVGLTTFLVGSAKEDGNIARQFKLKDIARLEPIGQR